MRIVAFVVLRGIFKFEVLLWERFVAENLRGGLQNALLARIVFFDMRDNFVIHFCPFLNHLKRRSFSAVAAIGVVIN